MTAPDPKRPVVREAVPVDAAAIADAHIRGWQATYRGIVPDPILDGFSVPARTGRWAERISARQGDPDARIWVVEVDGLVRGFASTGRANAEAAPPPPGAGEVFAIYLAPDQVGQGHGRALFAAAVDDLVARGLRPIVVWVFRANAAARRFYEAAGFVADGARHPIDFDGVVVDEIRYRFEPAVP